MLADLDSRDVRRDRLKLTPDFRRRVHLQVEHVLMGRRPTQVDHDDGLAQIVDALP